MNKANNYLCIATERPGFSDLQSILEHFLEDDVKEGHLDTA